jgi:hypothetical protein
MKRILKPLNNLVLLQALKGLYLAAVTRYSKEEARPRKLTVEQHSAGAAYSDFTTDVGRGEIPGFPQIVHKQQAGRHFFGRGFTVYSYRYFHAIT